jgi:hypothetical protein
VAICITPLVTIDQSNRAIAREMFRCKDVTFADLSRMTVRLRLLAAIIDRSSSLIFLIFAAQVAAHLSTSDSLYFASDKYGRDSF